MPDESGISVPRPAGWPASVLYVGLSVAGGLCLLVAALFAHGADLYAYWSVDVAHPYFRTTALQAAGAFFYSPPIALLMAPLSLLPWHGAMAAWFGLQVAALAYIGRRWAFVLGLLPPVWADIGYGNIYILFAAMIVAGYRHPSVWTFGLLTKVTPGIGLVWFAARREWRRLAEAGAVVGSVVALSVAVQGSGVWVTWLMTLQRIAAMPIAPDALPISLLPRVLAAVGLVAWGATRDRRWTIPIAMTLAMPTLWPIGLGPLIALPLLLGEHVTVEGRSAAAVALPWKPASAIRIRRLVPLRLRWSLADSWAGLRERLGAGSPQDERVAG